MARALVIRPFGTKKDTAGKDIDFERVQVELIGPALQTTAFSGSTTRHAEARVISLEARSSGAESSFPKMTSRHPGPKPGGNSYGRPPGGQTC